MAFRAPVLSLGRELLIDEQIRKAQEAGEVPAGFDSEREASTLLALVDGLMIHSLIDRHSAEVALATLDYHLDRIFTGSSLAE